MNVKIKQLMSRAGIKEDQFNELVLETFAKMVVFECAAVVENAVFHRLPASSYPNLIVEEFE